MASTWSNKLETRLSALADGASRESIQTLAKWIGFNRKHSKAFCTTLDGHLASSSAARQWLYIQIVHEVLLLEKENPTKWERLGEMRIAMGESVMLPLLKRSDKARKEKVAPLIAEWAKHNVFGSPTLTEQMRKVVSSESSQEQGEAAAKKKEVVARKEEAVAAKEEPKKEGKQVTTNEVATTEVKDDAPGTIADATKREQKLEKAKAERTPSLSLKPSASTEEVTFDFEGSGIPYAKVEAREFLEPCKVIASFQIARDLRNDAAVQLSSRLSAIPEEIKQFCRDAEASGSTPEISEEQASKFVTMLGDDILDTDLDEALENCKTFMSIVEQQQQARKQLIHLLIQSRCEFGSDEAAETFYSLDAVLEKIKERKQVLSDAMDLEGLDFEEDGANEADGAEVALEPLTWYKPCKPETKRARIG